jgi:hypothetical protein
MNDSRRAQPDQMNNLEPESWSEKYQGTAFHSPMVEDDHSWCWFRINGYRNESLFAYNMIYLHWLYCLATSIHVHMCEVTFAVLMHFHERVYTVASMHACMSGLA